MTGPAFRDIDRDDALGEAVERLYGCTRAGLLRGRRSAAPALLATLARPAAAPAAITDVEVLRFGLRFEQLQATFYTQAEELGTIGAMPPAQRRWAQTLGAHERAHVKIIKEVLGPKAEPAPAFDFGEANETAGRVHPHRGGDGGPHRRAARRRDAARPGPRPDRRAARPAHRGGAPRGLGAPHRRRRPGPATPRTSRWRSPTCRPRSTGPTSWSIGRGWRRSATPPFTG